MKKLTIILFLALVLGCYFENPAMANQTIKLSSDWSGTYQPESRESVCTDVASSYSLSYEYTVSKGLNEYGFGLEYQFNRELKDNSGANFNFTPIYGVFNRYFTQNKILPYLTGRIGYNFVTGNDRFEDNDPSGGYYFGIGGGLCYENFLIELLYTGNHTTNSTQNESVEMEYNKTSFIVGCKF